LYEKLLFAHGSLLFGNRLVPPRLLIDSLRFG
jgi:hypothetical protein